MVDRCPHQWFESEMNECSISILSEMPAFAAFDVIVPTSSNQTLNETKCQPG
jgi:hypothetical protein